MQLKCTANDEDDDDDCTCTTQVAEGVYAYAGKDGVRVDKLGSISRSDDKSVERTIAFFDQLTAIRPCVVCKEAFSLDGVPECLSCAYASFDKPITSKGKCPICLDELLSDDETACCHKPMHSVCARGILGACKIVCPLCRSADFAIVPAPVLD